MRRSTIYKYLNEYYELRPQLRSNRSSLIETALFIEGTFKIKLIDAEIKRENLGSHEAIKRFIITKLVRDSGFKVVVTGEGSDEVLLGYDIYREAKAREFLSSDPSSMRRMDILAVLYPWMARSPNKIPTFARAFFEKDIDLLDPAFSHRPRWNTTGAIQGLFHPDIRNEMSIINVIDELLSKPPDDNSNWEMMNRTQWLEYMTLLSGYIVSAQGDRMLMVHSVEGRFPFLDCNLVDFANGISPKQKLFVLDEKHLLKNACSDLIPQPILQRPKQPYRAPETESFFSPGNLDWVEDLTSEKN